MWIFRVVKTSLVFDSDVNGGHLTCAPFHLFTSDSDLSWKPLPQRSLC